MNCEEFNHPAKPSRRTFLSQATASAVALAAMNQSVTAEEPAKPAAQPVVPETGGAEKTYLTAGGTMPPDPPRVLKPTEANLGQLHLPVTQIARREEFPHSFLSGNFADYASQRKTAHAKVLELYGYRPAKVEPKAEVLDRVDCGEYFRERILFSTGPHFRVPAYVLVPKGLKEKAPAIVDLHSHGGMFLFGKEKVIDLADAKERGDKNHPAMVRYHTMNYDGRPTATQLVRRGYVVISIDAFFFGERRTMLDSALSFGWDRSKYSLDDVKTLNQHCRSKESTLVQELIYAGMTWTGIVAWDDMRTVDYLVSRPEVDPNRIGCQGVSLGGYRTIFLAGMDERIKAASIVGFMATTRSMMKSYVDKHSWVHYLPGLHAWLDWPDVAALAAPRALMVQQCSQDGLFPLDGMEKSVEKIAAIYKKAGFTKQFKGRFYDAPHKFSIPMQEDAIGWFDEQLKKS